MGCFLYSDRCFYTAENFIMIKRKSAYLSGFSAYFLFFAKNFLYILCIKFILKPLRMYIRFLKLPKLTFLYKLHSFNGSFSSVFYLDGY